MSLVAMLKGTGPSGFGYGSTAEEVTAGLDLGGQVFLVTGCNSGLGAETIRVLALRGATIIGAARTVEKAERAIAELPGVHMAIECELSEPESIRRGVAAVKASEFTINGIICNAGIMALPELNLHHGYELQFFTNHVGHFILVNALIEELAEDGRVVVVSSEAHKNAPKAGIEFDNLSGEKGYQYWSAYGQSKLANILMARELSRRFEGSARTANALHPGVIHTNLGRHSTLIDLGFRVLSPLALKSISQGASTQCFVATHPSVSGVSGEYFSDCNIARSTRKAADPELARSLWEVTEKLVASLS